MVGASFRGMPASCNCCGQFQSRGRYGHQLRTFNSANVKPRPARTRRLYLTVGQRTIGRSLSTGRGATFAAFSIRALRRFNFLAGWERQSQDIVVDEHCRRHCSQHGGCERGITWSKCVRTRRCQSLRKSARC